MRPEKPSSLQDIVRRRQRSDFVGRSEYLQLFRTHLSLAPQDIQRRFIFNIFGQAGVGKTWLSRQYREIAQADGVLVACVDEYIEDAVDAMAIMADQFDQLVGQLTWY
jgi:hypothetical protein